jgi:hypothetical protein
MCQTQRRNSADRHLSGPRSFAVLTVGAIGLALLAGCVSAPRGTRHALEPSLPALEVVAPTIEPMTLDGADPIGRGWFVEALRVQAVAATRRLVIEHQLAGQLAEGSGVPRVTGVVEVPVALPAGVAGSRATFRAGALARARLQVTDGGGRTLATATAVVEWDDVRWTRGGPKTRRARPIDAALVDAVDRAIERAVRQLASQLEAATSPPPRTAARRTRAWR